MIQLIMDNIQTFILPIDGTLTSATNKTERMCKEG